MGVVRIDHASCTPHVMGGCGPRYLEGGLPVWRLSIRQLKKANGKGPDVDGVAVLLPLDHLRWHPEGTAHHVTPLVTLHRVVQAQTKIDCVTHEPTKGKHSSSSPAGRQRYALSLTSPCVVIMMFALCKGGKKEDKPVTLQLLRSWLCDKGGEYLQIPVNELVLMQVEDPLEHLGMCSSSDNMEERENERVLSTRDASTATMSIHTSLATNAICFSWNSKPLIACRVVIGYFLSLSLLWLHCNVCCTVCVSQRWKVSNLRECAALHELGDDPELVQSGVGRDKSHDVGVVHPLEEVNFAQIAELIAWIHVLHLLHRNPTL